MTQQAGCPSPFSPSQDKAEMPCLSCLQPSPQSMQIMYRFRLLRIAFPSCIVRKRQGNWHPPNGCRPTAPCLRTRGDPSLRRNRGAPLRLLPPGIDHYPPLPLSPDAAYTSSHARRSGPGRLPASRRGRQRSAPLQPSAPQQPLNLHHLPATHLRFRGQGAIDLLHPRQTLLDGR
jgi:hypothetical protein